MSQILYCMRRALNHAYGMEVASMPWLLIVVLLCILLIPVLLILLLFLKRDDSEPHEPS